MPVIAVNTTSRSPYAAGNSFGDSGDYERIEGVFKFAVDPQNAANAAIVDLEHAPVDAGGRVGFESDFTLVAPSDPSRGNGRLIVEVVNRGRRRTVAFFNRGPTPPITSAEIPEGDGFLLRHGYSVLSIGWQWDVYRSDALLGLDAPEIFIDGEPVVGQACVEMRPNVVETTRLLANREHRPYPVADLNDPEAMLLVREWEDGPDTVIPRSQWRFPDAEHVSLESGFQPGKIYYVIYTAARPVVVGCGMLAIRDAAAWFRGANDFSAGYERIYAHGVSQCGRLLRHMAYLGINVDEAGNQVFDGMLPHVAGGRMGEFNHRFAQPSCQSNPGFGHQFPFSDNNRTDTLTEQTDGLLNRLREINAVPRIIYTDSAAEYWRGDACLTHVDTSGSADLEPAPETRRYLFAGTQHLPGAIDSMVGQGPDGSTGMHPITPSTTYPCFAQRCSIWTAGSPKAWNRRPANTRDSTTGQPSTSWSTLTQSRRYPHGVDPTRNVCGGFGKSTWVLKPSEASPPIRFGKGVNTRTWFPPRTPTATMWRGSGCRTSPYR